MLKTRRTIATALVVAVTAGVVASIGTSPTVAVAADPPGWTLQFSEDFTPRSTPGTRRGSARPTAHRSTPSPTTRVSGTATTTARPGRPRSTRSPPTARSSGSAPAAGSPPPCRRGTSTTTASSRARRPSPTPPRGPRRSRSSACRRAPAARSSGRPTACPTATASSTSSRPSTSAASATAPSTTTAGSTATRRRAARPSIRGARAPGHRDGAATRRRRTASGRTSARACTGTTASTSCPSWTSPTRRPRNNHFWHYHRKVLMDSFSQHPDRVGTGTGGRVCNAANNTYYNYRDGNFNTVNMWISGMPNWNPGPGGLPGNSQWFMTNCSGGVAEQQLSSAAELQPELMPGEYYTFAIERDATGYVLEATGNFARSGQRTIRLHRPFVVNNAPIWHYNTTAGEYNGQFNGTLVQNDANGSASWPNQWPAGSAYPDYFVIGDVYTNVYEGSATIDDIKLYVPSTTPPAGNLALNRPATGRRRRATPTRDRPRRSTAPSTAATPTSGAPLRRDQVAAGRPGVRTRASTGSSCSTPAPAARTPPSTPGRSTSRSAPTAPPGPRSPPSTANTANTTTHNIAAVTRPVHPAQHHHADQNDRHRRPASTSSRRTGRPPRHRPIWR